MESRSKVTKNDSLYHFQGSQNKLDIENEFELQKKEIAQFINREVFNKNKNLSIFIGSGCSTPAVPLMGITMKNMLNNAKNTEIKQEFTTFLRLKDDHITIFEKYLVSDLEYEEWQIAKSYDNFCNIEGFLRAPLITIN
ncbi:hypothetical protein [Lactococcus raffinolactis]|uniref:hypothetical protein n=1 Tax=Pseudolactococcus raffinolactis TaxID=1366 RepID=UPI0034CE9858